MKHPLLQSFCFSLLIFGLLGCSGNGQKDTSLTGEQTVDSVLVLLEKGKNIELPAKSRQQYLREALVAMNADVPDSLRLYYYSQVSIGYQRLGDSLSFRKYNGLLRNLAEKLDNKRELANSHWDLAAYFGYRTIRDSAFYHYYQAYNLMDEIGEMNNAGTLLLNMAIQQSKARAYVESEKTTFRALELLEMVQDTARIFSCYNNLGTVTKELEAYDRSLEFFDRAEEYAILMEESEKAKRLRTLNNNRGNVFKEQAKWEEAIPYFEAALQLDSLEQKHPRAYAQTLNNLTISRFLSGDTTNVFKDLNKALQIHTVEEDIAGISLTNYNLATYFADIGDKKKAVFYALDAIEKAEQSSNYKRKLEALKLLGEVDPQNYLYFDEYVILSDSLQKEERQIRDKFARIERETDEALAEAEALAKEQQLFLGIIIGLALLGVASLIIIFQRIRVQRLRFQQQQQEANEEIFNLMLTQKQKVEEGKQSEQKRISEELHDGVLGAMNGIRMVLLGLNKKDDDSSVTMREEAIEKLKDVQEEIRAISHELSDAAYQKFSNFINSIQDLIKEMGDSSGLNIQLNYDEGVDWDALSGDTKINLYRIVQESLQNTVKHAQAEQVDIAFESWDHMLKISVSDDGRGFDTRKMKKGIGHRNIKSRVEKINGTWNIESTIGKGSRITVILPHTIAHSDTGLLVNEEGELREVKKD